MKLFIKKTLLFLIPAVLIFYIKPIYLLSNSKYKSRVAGKEIYLSIKKSKQKSNKKILLIGDSVGKQLFNNEDDYDTINSLACNQAIGVIGQYFLLNNYLKAGNKPKELFMIYTPFSFQNNLNQVYTYHYFLKPFYRDEYMDLFSETALNQVNKIPFSSFCHEPYILTSNWAPNFTTEDDPSYTFLSPISKEYIEKIIMLCSTNDIDFYIIPTPTKIANKEKVAGFDQNEVKDLKSEKELSYFLNNIHYFSDSLYLDEAHLKSPEQFRDFMLKEMNKARKK